MGKYSLLLRSCFQVLWVLLYILDCSLLLEVSNTQPGLTPHSGRRLLFTHTAFDYHSSGLVCSDQLGDIYYLDLTRNKLVSSVEALYWDARNEDIAIE